MQQNIDINKKNIYAIGLIVQNIENKVIYILFANRGAATVNLCVACSVR